MRLSISIRMVCVTTAPSCARRLNVNNRLERLIHRMTPVLSGVMGLAPDLSICWHEVFFRYNLKDMAQRQKYIPRAAPVVAVQLDLDTPGFIYKKWGGEQKCKRGDWLIDNAGEIYTVDQETFRKTYRKVQTGLYKKVSPVGA